VGGGPGDLGRAPQVGRAARVAQVEQGVAEVVERVGHDVALAGALAQLQGLAGLGDGLVEAVGELHDGGQVGGGAGQPGQVAERRQQGHGAGHGLLGPGRVVDHVAHPRQGGEGLPERGRVAGPLAQGDHLARAGHRLVEAGEVVEHPDALLQHGRPLGVRQLAGPAQHQLVVGQGLGEGPGAGRLPGGGQAVADDRLGVAGLVGVVGQPRQLDPRAAGQLGQDPAVAGHPGRGGALPLDRPAGQLVPEPHVPGVGLEHAAPLGLVQGRHLAVEQRLDQPALGLPGDGGEQLQGPLGWLAQPAQSGQDGVPDRGRHLDPGVGQHLGHEERVAGRGRQHRPGVGVVAAGQLLDRAGRQRPQHQPPHLLGPERAQHPAQRMVVAQLVVAVGQQQHAGQGRDPPGQVADHVKGGVVGPVDVLDDHHRRPAGQLPVDGAEHGVASGHRLHRPGQGAAGPTGHVPERAEGARCDQVVAGADEHPGVGRRLPCERPDEAGLADPGLARDEHDRAATLHGSPERLPQPAKLGVPLQ
jgi:hypothetical protein